jgi:hypothetical protein
MVTEEVPQGSNRRHSFAGSERSSSVGTDLHDAGAEEEPEEPGLAKNETNAVRGLKLLVILAMTLSAIGVALAVYFYIRASENRDFENQFEGDATKVLAALGNSLDSSLAAVDAFVVGIVSYAKATNQTWPFVTIPDYAVRAGKIRSLSDAVVIGTYPLVKTEDRKEWERYTAENNYWVEESLDIQEKDSSFTGPIVREYENWDVIYFDDEYEKEQPGLNGTDRDGKSALRLLATLLLISKITNLTD